MPTLAATLRASMEKRNDGFEQPLNVSQYNVHRDLRKAAKYESLSLSQIVLFILFLDRRKKQKAPMQAVKEVPERLSATRYVLSTMHKIYLGFLTWLASACPGKSEIHQ
jgi:hypothetical protein